MTEKPWLQRTYVRRQVCLVFKVLEELLMAANLINFILL